MSRETNVPPMYFEVNTMTADGKYFRHNNKNLWLSIEVQLFITVRIICISIAFSESTLNVRHFEKKLILKDVGA